MTSPSLRPLVIVGAAMAAVLIVAGLAMRGVSPNSATLLSQARLAFVDGDYARADELARQVIRRQPDDLAALMLAGRAAEAQSRFAEAVEYWRQIPTRSEAGLDARIRSADVLLHELRRPYDAAQELRAALEKSPEYIPAVARLAYVLGLTSQSRAAGRLRTALIRLDAFGVEHLHLLALGETALENPEEMRRCADASPQDPYALLAAARLAAEHGDKSGARELLEHCRSIAPSLPEAALRLGRLIVDEGDFADWPRWHASLPSPLEDEAALWGLRGDYAMHCGRLDVAGRCYWEAVRRDPNDERTLYRLSQCLRATGNSAAGRFHDRASALQGYVNAVKIAAAGDRSAGQRAARLAADLGLLWEAYGWCRLILGDDPRATWAAQLVRDLEPELPHVAGRTVPSANPANALDLSAITLPDWSLLKPQSTRASDDSRHAVVSFRNDAAEAGLRFRYFQSPSPPGHGQRMQEFTGGGVGVLDYDGDLWPDVLFTQGCDWPPAGVDTTYRDALFRNRGSAFRDVSIPARLASVGFGQGVAIGDYDEDGFPDIFVANIGANQLFHNQGDGTFLDVTEAAGISGEQWSTGAAFGDFDADGLSELYVVNYLEGSDLFDRVCIGTDGRPRSCLPQHFDAAPDRLYRNLGDGRFEDVTAAAGVTASQGKGLGLVVADFNQDRALDVFVANDAEPNHLYLNRGAAQQLAFEEVALPNGVALNGDGRVEACMGIAAEDFNDDGELDLFVTNYYLESNTLYLGGPDAAFEDATRRTGLYDSSLRVLGFGTQALDADWDGAPDLFVVNGHVEDQSAEGIPYRMPAQFFANRTGGRFEELSAATLGPYFQQPHLGRGVARCDWNRDGKEDLVVSQLLEEAALLTNTTPSEHHHVTIRLRGTNGNRDAVGARVTVRTSERTFHKQLTTGDGYMASNERHIVFGLGDDASVHSVVIAWPAGSLQTVEGITLNCETLVIEGRDGAITLPRR